ncbi:MAG: enoyl-CoA hydratase/isomerase family protein [Parvibaculaceae bacterium]
MSPAIVTHRAGRVEIVTLNKPEKLNAWDKPMREQLMVEMDKANRDPEVGALVLTGAGSRAFCAGQDLTEARSFTGERGESWIAEWQRLYDVIRSLDKPLVAALNGLAVGSAFQVALLCDFRIAHPGVRMGQPEINAGIASTTGPWIMREMLGLARTIDLTLTGRLLGADECLAIGLLSRIVPPDDVLPTSIAFAEELAAKAPVAMRLNKRWFREMTAATFAEAIAAGARNQRESFASGEPARMIERFYEMRRR